MSEWVRSDPAQAKAYLEKLDVGLRTSAISPVVCQMVEGDPAGAVDYAIKMVPDSEQGKWNFFHLGQSIGETNGPQAVMLAQRIPSSSDRMMFLTSALGSWSHSDPQAAADCAKQSLSGHEQYNVVPEIIRNWASTNPVEAPAWLEKFPDGIAKYGGITNLISSWAEEDTTGAGEWLKRLSPGSTRDAGLETYVNVISFQDPAAATQWANSISEQHSRDSSVSSNYRQWAKVDAAAARQWLEGSAVSDDTKKQLSRELNDTVESISIMTFH